MARRNPVSHNRRVPADRDLRLTPFDEKADEQKQAKKGTGLRYVREKNPYKGISTGAGISIPGTKGYEGASVSAKRKD